MSREEAEAALIRAQQNGASMAEQLGLKSNLDAAIREEEVQKQAVFFGISEEEARQRIEQNDQERAAGVERTIWPEPTTNGGNA